jgi:hypothetical protein
MFEDDREYTRFAHAQLLRNWGEQRPTSQEDLNSSVTVEVERVHCTVEVERVHCTGMGVLLVSFLYLGTWLLLECVVNGALYLLSLLQILFPRKDHRLRTFANTVLRTIVNWEQRKRK